MNGILYLGQKYVANKTENWDENENKNKTYEKIKKQFLGVVHCESLLSLFYSVEALNEGLNMLISMIAVYAVKCYVFES